MLPFVGFWERDASAMQGDTSGTSGKEPFPPLDFLVPCLWEHIPALQLAVSDEIAHGWALCKLPLTAASYHAQTSPSLTSHCSLFLFIKSVQQFSLKSVSWLSLCQLIPSCPSQQAQDITHLSVPHSWNRKTISQVRRLQHISIPLFCFPLATLYSYSTERFISQIN